MKQEEPNSQESPHAGMSAATKAAIVVALVVVVAVVLVLKNRNGADTATVPPVVDTESQATALPRFVDLGSTTCIPCKMMAPIIEELRAEYAGRLQVDFIDVNKDRESAAAFGVRIIPVQVFLDATGKELFRHEGFYDKEDILAKWKELGVEFKPASTGEPAPVTPPAM